jgi:hypothetical protein
LPRIRDLLDDSDRGLAAAAAACLLKYSAPDAELAEVRLHEYVEGAQQGDVRARTTAARLIGFAPPTAGLRQDLSRFLKDSHVEVVRAALESAAAAQPPDEVPAILEKLCDRRVRREARQALAAYGEPILDTLDERARSPSLDPLLRQEIPRVMGAVGGAKAAGMLLDYLQTADRETRAQVLRALVRIRQEQPHVVFDSERTSSLATEEVRRYYLEATLLHSIPSRPPQPGKDFLQRTLRERRRQRLNSIFRLLALSYSRREMMDAYHWITTGRPDLRSNALEFLDTQLHQPLREMLLTALESGDGERLLRAAQTQFGLKPLSFAGLVESLLDRSDPWLQACACYVAAEGRLTDLLPRLQKLAGSPEPLLSEAAERSYVLLSGNGHSRPAAGV